MAKLTVQNASLNGLDPDFENAAAGGDTFENDGSTVLHVKNGGGASIDVTVNSETKCNFGFDHDVTVSVPAGGERIIGPFPRNRFGSPTSISYSDVTSVTIAALSHG